MMIPFFAMARIDMLNALDTLKLTDPKEIIAWISACTRTGWIISSDIWAKKTQITSLL